MSRGTTKNKENYKTNKPYKNNNKHLAARRTGGFQPPSKAGKHDFNIIQINTSKAKQATMDLIDFAIKFNSSFILTQEPYANGKNK